VEWGQYEYKNSNARGALGSSGSALANSALTDVAWSNSGDDDEATALRNQSAGTIEGNDFPADVTTIGRCFLRLANLDSGAFERLTRYETALWRQVGQILFTLDAL
jgi:hypothetical protein